MRHLFYETILACVFLLASTNLFSQAGTLDQDFGNNGIVIYNFEDGFHDFTNDILVFDDSSILACGGFMDSSNFIATGNLQKFLADGSIDTSWGTGGMVTFQFGESTIPENMIVLEDGKILVSGTTYLTTPDGEFFVARFNQDGSADTTFNGTGVWNSTYAADEEICKAMIVQSDGKIVLAGRTGTTVMNALLIVRLNSDGTVDTSFGTDGYTEINSATQNEHLYGLGQLSDGSIVAVGFTHLGDPWFGELAIMLRLGTDGNPYPGFGTNGVLIPSVFTDYSKAQNCVIVDDAVYITALFGDPYVNQDLAVTKLDQNGDPDLAFGTNGISTLDIDPLTQGEDIVFGADGKIYIAGSSGSSGIGAPRDFFLARYNPNGLIDTSFHGVGYLKTSVGNAWDHAYAVDFAPNGKIVLGGFTAMGPTGDNDRALTRYNNDIMGVAEESPMSSVRVYPNPVSEVLSIHSSKQIKEISIFNSVGQRIASNLGTKNGKLNVSHLAAGVYILKIELDGGKIETVKVVKK